MLATFLDNLAFRHDLFRNMSSEFLDVGEAIASQTPTVVLAGIWHL